MGEVPATPPDTAEVTFDFPIRWSIGADWSMAGGILTFDKIFMAGGFTEMTGLTFIAGSYYKFEIEVSNFVFGNPNGELYFTVTGSTDEVSITGNGLYTHHFFIDETYTDIAKIRFHQNNTLIGDYADLSNIIFHNTGAYVSSELGFRVASGERSEFFEAAQADYQQIIASRNGKSNLSILFNYPP